VRDKECEEMLRDNIQVKQKAKKAKNPTKRNNNKKHSYSEKGGKCYER